jgi:hypothetical protein
LHGNMGCLKSANTYRDMFFALYQFFTHSFHASPQNHHFHSILQCTSPTLGYIDEDSSICLDRSCAATSLT